MRKTLFISCFWFSFVFGGLNTGYPSAWGKVSEDKSRILVILPASMLGDTEKDSNVTLPDGRNIYLRDYFDESGVYDLDTMGLLWNLDLLSASGLRMDWNEDFSNMVIWHAENFELTKGVQLGLNFLKDGEVHRFYSEDELYVRFSKWYFLPHKIVLGEWNSMEMKVEGEHLIYRTPRRFSPSPWGMKDIGYWETYTFDMETGEILSLEIEDTKTKKIIAVVLGGLVMIISSIIGLMIWLNRRAKPLRNPLR